VVGLVISLIGMTTLQFKQRWYAKDTNNLDYVAQILTQNKGKI
jgi:integral membrane protein